CRHSHGLADQGGFDVGVFAEDGHAFLFELTAKNTVNCGGVTESVLDALNLYGLIADDLHADVVALLIQTQIFKQSKMPIQLVPPILVTANVLPRRSSALLMFGLTTRS